MNADEWYNNSNYVSEINSCWLVWNSVVGWIGIENVLAQWINSNQLQQQLNETKPAMS